MSVAQRTRLGFRSRSRTYTLIISVVIVMLAAGLSIPFVFGTSIDTVSTAAPSPLGLGSSDQRGGPAERRRQAAAATPTGVGGGRGTDQGGAAGSGLAGGTAGVEGLTASDHGVTATTITIAFLLADLGSLSQLGFGVPGFNVKDQEAYIRVFVDNINAQGGVYGRQIDPVFVTYDPTNQQTSAGRVPHRDAGPRDLRGDRQRRRAQRARPAVLHRAEPHAAHRPRFVRHAAALYEQSGGYLFTINASGLRSLANMAYLLDARGLLKGKRIGIIDRDFPGTVQTVTDGLVTTLEQYGYEVTYRVDLSMDDGTAASQVPVAVQQMQTHGVDAIMLLTDFIIGTEFVQSADRRAYRPLYFASDFGPMTSDTAVMSMPASFQAVGVTTARTGEWRVGAPEPAVDAACRRSTPRRPVLILSGPTTRTAAWTRPAGWSTCWSEQRPARALT